MKLIAHRGNVDGPQPKWENRPEHIMDAVEAGFDVEVDVLYSGDTLLLGHDFSNSRMANIEFWEFFYANIEKFWIHCENPSALYYFLRKQVGNFFFHNDDLYTLTSRGDLWCYPGAPILESSTQKTVVACMPEKADPNWEFEVADAICSDYLLGFS